jgi:DNA-binding NarL/FixJ family response regulator
MPTSAPLRLALVEDDAELRQLYAAYLCAQPELQCVLLAASAEDFFEQLTDVLLPPQVVLLDVGLPGRSGLDALPRLKQLLPQTEVVMHTVFDDSDRIYQALCRGASGYVLKNQPLTELKAAVLEVARGGAPMSRAVARQVLAHFKPTPTTQAGLLSEREQQVLEGMVDGLSDKQVAIRLGLAPETVRTHVKNIYRKLQVNSRAELLSRHTKGRL